MSSDQHDGTQTPASSTADSGSRPHPVLKWTREHRQAYLELLEDIVNIDSPTDEPEAVDRVGKVLAECFDQLGLTVTRHAADGAGDHLEARWTPTDGTESDASGHGGKGIGVSGQMDTVWPLGETDERPFAIEEGRASGPGVLDMKAGLVNAVFALRALKELGRQPRIPVTVLLTSDEETGSATSRSLIEETAAEHRAVLVLEPAIAVSGALKTHRKGVGDFSLHVEGRAAHAGAAPEEGIDAVRELAHQILRLHELAAPAEGTTVNVGVVRGGSRPNVVAAEAAAEIDLRVASEDESVRMDRGLRGVEPVTDGARLRVEGEINRPPMEPTEANLGLFEQARAAARELGLALASGGTGGASDGNFTSALGIATLDGLGAVGTGLHAVDEHIDIDRTLERAALLAALLKRLSGTEKPSG